MATPSENPFWLSARHLANKEQPEDPCWLGGRRTVVSKSGSQDVRLPGLARWLVGWLVGVNPSILSQHNALTNTLLASLLESLRHDTGRKISRPCLLMGGVPKKEMSSWRIPYLTDFLVSTSPNHSLSFTNIKLNDHKRHTKLCHGNIFEYPPKMAEGAK